ncbi:two-component response regulator ORR24-like [Zingiber officinale]|uniref:two-component response regulator ORR24-like n=1 Tax=Zingiber officinale TaxID=94328 RepID=UPI001C4DAB0D|nr:two-component response regulator ORR24-like [Zingiber officinale]
MATANEFPISIRVLAIDNDPICLKLLENLLIRCQYQVVATTQASSGLRMLRENTHEFDLDITDIHMADMDGFMLLQIITREFGIPVIIYIPWPAIAVSSVDGARQTVAKAVVHGACQYLLKPVRMQELRNVWQHVLRKKLVGGKPNALADSEGSYSSDFNASDDENAVGGNFPPESGDSRGGKRPRISWTLELHQKFLAAINELGIDSRFTPSPVSFLSSDEIHDFLRAVCRGCAEEDTRSYERREPDEGESRQPFTGTLASSRSIFALFFSQRVMIFDLCLQKYRQYVRRLKELTDRNSSANPGGLSFRNLSRMKSDSLDVFRRYHAVGRMRILPPLASFPTYPVAGVDMLSGAAALGHSPGHLGSYQSFGFAGNNCFRPNSLGGSAPTPLDQLGEIQQQASGLLGGSGSVPDGLGWLLQGNKPQMADGEEDSFDFEIDFPELDRCLPEQAWRNINGDPASERLAGALPGCQSAVNMDETAQSCEINGDGEEGSSTKGLV